MEIKPSLVSVIITTYNRDTFLKETLESISKQTYTEFEIILVDDGSEQKIANENKTICSGYNSCNYYYKNNTGQPDSRNYGLKLAKGDYIAFCDDDDYWAMDKLEKQMEVLHLHPDVDIVTGDIYYIDHNGKKLNLKSHQGYNQGYIFENILCKNRIFSATPLLRRKVFNKTGLFNPKFTIAEDWDFWRRASYYHKFYSTNSVLAYVRIHDSNMTYKSDTLYNRIILYRKLSDELLKWGKNKFSNKEKRLILYYEKKKYHRLISNNLNTKWKQIKFLMKLVLRRPSHGVYIISLFLFKR